MCASIASLCRVKIVVYAYPDPVGGASRIEKKNLPNWNIRHWPIFEQFEQETYKNTSYKLLIKYMNEHREIWGRFLNKILESK